MSPLLATAGIGHIMAWGRVAASVASQLARSSSHWPRLFSSAAVSGPLNFCIVGSGPAGFYTADKVAAISCWLLGCRLAQGKQEIFDFNLSFFLHAVAEEVWGQGKSRCCGELKALMTVA